jgi:hypothetical protein
VRGGRGQRGQRGPEREVLAAAGVDPAQQRLDDAVHQLLAHPPADPLGHRDVPGVGRVGGPRRVLPGPGQPPGRQQAGGGQLVEVGGHAHELPPGQRPDLAAGPDPGRGGARLAQLAGQAQLGDQPDALGPAGQQGLGAGVHLDAADLGDGQLPAQPRRALQHGHGQAGVAEQERGGQPGDAAADDDHGRRPPGAGPVGRCGSGHDDPPGGG